MIHLRAAILLWALLLAGAACAEPAPSAAAIAAATTRAEAAAHSLTSALITELTAALQAGDAASAVNVCGEVAQSITIRNGGEDGFEIRRTALRVRNPLNAPSAHERAVLERWAEEAEPQDWSEVAAIGDGHELRWMRPIRLLPMCAQCHGAPSKEILPATLATIRSRYPDDQATGFAPGDLRGAISVRAPLPTTE